MKVDNSTNTTRVKLTPGGTEELLTGSHPSIEVKIEKKTAEELAEETRAEASKRAAVVAAEKEAIAKEQERIRQTLALV